MYYLYYSCAILTCFLGAVIILPPTFRDLLTEWYPMNLFEEESKRNPIMNTSLTDGKILASSVWCLERIDGSKLCQFQNIYFFPHFKGCLFFLLNEHSVISGIKSEESLKGLGLSSVKNHTGLNLKLIIIKSKQYFPVNTIKIYEKHTFLMRRFKPDNILHVIHDDLLPLFVTYQELCVGNVQECVSKYHLFFVDSYKEGPFYEWYEKLSTTRPMILNHEESGICFQHGAIGLSHSSIWYQYGFKNTHGRFLNPQFDGSMLPKFTDFMKEGFKIKQDVFNSDSEERTTIVFLSRKLNRKIVNENIVEQNIKSIHQNLFNKSNEIINLDVSVNSSQTLISAITKTRFLIGMHGSAMILAIFLPPGSSIIELFPFGIQPLYVSPLSALCSQPNIFYNYLTWVNKNESNTRTHPDYPPLHGGISHLTPSEQEEIISVKLVPPVECCHNPTYLFRMFQDTVVDDSFYRLVSGVFISQEHIAAFQNKDYETKVCDHKVGLWYFPPPVFNISCKCFNNKLNLSWSFPFNSLSSVKFSLAVNTGVSVTIDHTDLAMEVEQCHEDNFTSSKTSSQKSVWIKTLEGKKESLDSYIQCVL